MRTRAKVEKSTLAPLRVRPSDLSDLSDLDSKISELGLISLEVRLDFGGRHAIQPGKASRPSPSREPP